MFLKAQKRMLSFLLALVLLLSVFMSVAVFPASAADENFGVKLPGAETEVGFNSLQDAVAYVNANATESGSVITVLKDTTFSGSCTIPSGTTLLVPCDAAHTVNASVDENNIPVVQTVYGYETPSSFCTMTMASGSSITVADGGKICVNSFLSSIGTVSTEENWNGSPTGPNGRIRMQSTSTITLGDGAELYAFGYIYEDDSTVVYENKGKVEALDGSTVYEAFQIKNYRGLNASLNAVGNSGVFPFNQYYVQNIEVPMYAYAGANEVGVAALHNTGSGIYLCPVCFIGEDGLFRLTADDAYLIKDYVEAEDRLNVQIYGDSELSAVTLSLYGQTLDSSSLNLPITNNVTVEIVEGSTEINQNIAMLPGTEMVVDDGADVTIASTANVYVYDAVQWSSDYVGSTDAFVGVGYTVANGETTNTIRETAYSQDGMPSAKVDINGDVVVNGGFYATGYADISSSEGTGSIVFNTTAGAAPSYQECDASGNAEPVVFGAVFLKVPDSESETGYSYINTAPEGSVDNGMYTITDEGYNFLGTGTVLFYDMNNDPLGDGENVWFTYYVDCVIGVSPVYNGPVPSLNASWDPYDPEIAEYVPEELKTTELGSFIGWSTEPFSSVAEYPTGASLPPCMSTEDITEYYAVYSIPTATKHSLSLDGTIGVNFYLKQNNYSVNKMTADFSWGKSFVSKNNYSDEPRTMNNVTGQAKTLNGINYVLFTLPVSLKEINDEIAVSYKCDGEEVTNETFKPTDYLYELYEKDNNQLAPYLRGTQTAKQLRELVRTLMISAADAQTSFNYNTGALATYRFSNLEISTNLNAVKKSKLHYGTDYYPADDAFNDITFYGSALYLEDTTGYTLYFNINTPGSINAEEVNVFARITVGDEEKALPVSTTVISNGSILKVKMVGLAAAEITNDITFTYNNTEITVNTGDYIALALDSGNTALVNTVTALYNYNQAAIAFFGGNNE